MAETKEVVSIELKGVDNLSKVVKNARRETDEFEKALKKFGRTAFINLTGKDTISAAKTIGTGKKLRISGKRTPEGWWKTRESYSMDLDAPKKAKLKKEAEVEKTRIREEKEADKTRLRKQKDDEKVVRLAKREKEQTAKATQRKYEKEHGFTEVKRIGGEAVVTTGFFGKKGERNIKSVTKRLGGFRMEMLSVLFNMQGLNNTFKSLFTPALEASGVFEVFSAVMTAVMLPVLEPIIATFMWLMDILLGLSEPVQFVIGLIAGLAAVITGVIATVASWILLFSGFGSMSAFIAEVVTVITGTLGILVGSILGIIAIILLVYAAWTQNWWGIRDKVKDVVEWIKTKLGVFTGWLGGILEVPLQKLQDAWTGFKKWVGELWDGIVTLAKDWGGKLVNGIVDGIKAIAYMIGDAIWAPIKAALNILGQLAKPVMNALGIGTVPGGFMSSPYVTSGGTVYEGIHAANGLYDLNASRAGNNLTYAPIINITASISSDMDLRRIADRLDSMMQDRMRKYVRGT